MNDDALVDFECKAGLIWHATAISRIVAAAPRRRLLELIGEAGYGLALESRSLASPSASEVNSPDGIVLAAHEDGPACLTAWAISRMRGAHFGSAILLRLARPVSGDHLRYGPPVIEWLLKHHP